NQVIKFHGNYSKYLIQKAEMYERDMKSYEKQQDEVAKMQDFIQRNIARSSTTKRAQSRRKQLERMQLMDKPFGGEKSATFTFGIDKQSGNNVLQIHDAKIGYDDTPLAAHIHLSIYRQDSM